MPFLLLGSDIHVLPLAHGDPEKVIIERVPKQMTIPSTVLVKVHVSAVNPVDFKVLKGSRWGESYKTFIFSWEGPLSDLHVI